MDAPTSDTRADYWVAQLVARGLSETRARILAAAPGVDLHAVRAALDNGCPPNTAWRIFHQEAPPVRRRRSSRAA